MYLPFKAVVIGFEKEVYSVGEFDGQAVVIVAVLGGELSRIVQIQLMTQNGNATGN